MSSDSSDDAGREAPEPETSDEADVEDGQRKPRKKTLLAGSAAAADAQDEAGADKPQGVSEPTVAKGRGKDGTTGAGRSSSARGKYWGKSRTTKEGPVPAPKISSGRTTRMVGSGLPPAPDPGEGSSKNADALNDEPAPMEEVTVDDAPPSTPSPPKPPPKRDMSSRRPPAPTDRASDRGAGASKSLPPPPRKKPPAPPPAPRRSEGRAPAPPAKMSEPPPPPSRLKRAKPMPKRVRPKAPEPKRDPERSGRVKAVDATGPHAPPSQPTAPEPAPSQPTAPEASPKGPPVRSVPPPARKAPEVDRISDAMVAKPPPQPVVAREELDSIPSPSLKMRSIVEVCEAELKLDPDPVRAARLHFEIGRAAAADGDDARALKHFRVALDKAPDHLPSIREARRLQLDKRNVKAAAELYDVEIKLATSAHDKALLHFLKGCAWQDIDDDEKTARQCFAEAVELDARNCTILKALRHAELRAKEWAGLSKTLEHEANAVADNPQHRAAILKMRASNTKRR